MYKLFFKRLLDLLVVITALALVWWVLAIVYVWLSFANKGAGAIFYQERPGKGGRIFKVMKFKTMTDEKDSNGMLLPDTERLTNVGRFVRSTSLDELPQLINVLKGDMSLIGPRPLLVHYLPWYTTEQARRHEVRPGITGWAQVNGRNLCKLSKKFEYDVWYVDHCSFATDMRILWMTAMNVVNRKDVGEGTGNMQEVDDLGFHEKYLAMLREKGIIE